MYKNENHTPVGQKNENKFVPYINYRTMCSHQNISQSSCDFDEYLQYELTFEDTKYQSFEGLMDAVFTSFGSSAHRTELQSFNQISADMEARLTLKDIDTPSTNTSVSNANDFGNYRFGQSTVVPHMPTEAQINPSPPLSPASMDTYKDESSHMPAPSSPPHLNSTNIRPFRVFDETTGRYRSPHLHEFTRQLLENDEYSHLAQYVDRKQGIFKLHRPNEVAALWKHVKGRNSDKKMTYDKLARALRYYYGNGIMHPNPKRFTFQFGPKSGFGTTWSAVY